MGSNFQNGPKRPGRPTISITRYGKLHSIAAHVLPAVAAFFDNKKVMVRTQFMFVLQHWLIVVSCTVGRLQQRRVS